MTEQDLPMLHDWLNRPHIVEWWGGESARPTLEEVHARYLPRILAQDRVAPYIAMLQQVPMGYAQSYVALGSGDGWWEEETDPGVRGMIGRRAGLSPSMWACARWTSIDGHNRPSISAVDLA